MLKNFTVKTFHCEKIFTQVWHPTTDSDSDSDSSSSSDESKSSNDNEVVPEKVKKDKTNERERGYVANTETPKVGRRVQLTSDDETEGPRHKDSSKIFVL